MQYGNIMDLVAEHVLGEGKRLTPMQNEVGERGK
jgi:hypothetical protein